MNRENLHSWLTLAANVGDLIGVGLLIDEIRHIQCQHGLLNDATCTITQRVQLEFLLPMAKGVGVDLVGRTPGFIAEVQGAAREKGLPCQTMTAAGLGIEPA